MHSSVAPVTTTRPTPRWASTDSRSVASKASPYRFGTSRRRGAQLGHVLPRVTPLGQCLVVGVLHPDDRHLLPGAVDEGRDGRDGGVTVDRVGHDAVLYVDDMRAVCGRSSKVDISPSSASTDTSSDRCRPA